jgi:hypothetical protein
MSELEYPGEKFQRNIKLMMKNNIMAIKLVMINICILKPCKEKINKFTTMPVIRLPMIIKFLS